MIVIRVSIAAVKYVVGYGSLVTFIIVTTNKQNIELYPHPSETYFLLFICNGLNSANNNVLLLVE